MKNYAKVGGKAGKPAYRTPSSFLAKKFFEKIKYQSQKIQKFLLKNRRWTQKSTKKPPIVVTEEKR